MLLGGTLREVLDDATYYIVCRRADENTMHATLPRHEIVKDRPGHTYEICDCGTFTNRNPESGLNLTEQYPGRNNIQAGTISRPEQYPGRNNIQAGTISRPEQYPGRNNIQAGTIRPEQSLTWRPHQDSLLTCLCSFPFGWGYSLAVHGNTRKSIGTSSENRAVP